MPPKLPPKKTSGSVSLPSDDRDEDSAEGEGGSSQIEFIDFLENRRDEELSKEEKKHLLTEHQDVHYREVEKQKALVKQRQEIKAGKIPLQSLRGAGLEKNSGFLPNPILADKAQFSGATDEKVNPVPTENNAETNDKKQEELKKEFDKQYRPENVPRLTPTYKPPGA